MIVLLMLAASDFNYNLCDIDGDDGDDGGYDYNDDENNNYEGDDVDDYDNKNKMIKNKRLFEYE